MRLVVDTGVLSAALSKRRRQALDGYVTALQGHQVFLSIATVAELRYGALLAEWGSTATGTTRSNDRSHHGGTCVG